MDSLYGSRGRAKLPFYQHPAVLCVGSFLLFALITWICSSPTTPSSPPDGITDRGELLWKYGLFEEAVELEQENNKMATQLNTMAETEAHYQQKVTDARHQLTRKQKALKLKPTGTGCGDLQQKLDLCVEDRQLMDHNYDSLYNKADQVPTLNLDFIKLVREGKEDALSQRMKDKFSELLN